MKHEYTREELLYLCDAMAEGLTAATAYLDWIGWGDSYERGCAKGNGDMARIEAASARASDFLEGKPPLVS